MTTVQYIQGTNPRPNHRLQRGASLIMVLLILVVVSMLGVGGAQIALMSERGARNDRDQQMAWQAAEAGLIDAENDIWNPAVTSTRRAVFDGKSIADFPSSGCGTSGNALGLCAAVSTGKPAWLTADFTSSAATTAFGTFTSASFESGGAGIQPAQVPRYIIEPVISQTGDAANPEQEVLYRVTSMGFGPRADIQSVVQMLFRI
jgi:type IV pilus assembly protein PilX